MDEQIRAELLMLGLSDEEIARLEQIVAERAKQSHQEETNG
jgi:hypothetical protein